MKNKEKAFVIPIIIAVLVLITLGGVFYFNYNQNPEIQTIEGEIVNVSYFTIEEFLAEHNSLSSSNVNFLKNNSFRGTVMDPQNNHRFYFIDNTFTQSTNKQVEIYRLDVLNNELTIIHKIDLENYSFHIAGIQGEQLLLEKIDSMDSPGPCHNIWTYAYENPLPRPTGQYKNKADSRTIKSLNTNSLDLIDFVVSEEKYIIEKSIQDKCVENLNEV